MTLHHTSAARRITAARWLLGLAVATNMACALAQSGTLAPATGSLSAPTGSLSAVPQSDHGTLVAGNLPDEHAARQAVADEFSAAFLGERFDELERLYTQAVKDELRLPSGVFKAPYYVSGLQTALRRPPAAFDADPAVARAASLAHWARMGALADRWAKAFPKSTGAVVIQSELLLRQGFVYRGGGYASSVSPADMTKFRQYVERAYQALAARAAPGQRDPVWHMQLLEVGRLQGWQPAKRYATAVQTAIAAFPYFYDIYFLAAEASVPQWGGDAQTVESIASWAAERTQDREGQSLYARIYWAMASYFDDDPVQNGKAQWPRLKAGFEDMARRYPDPWNLNTFAFFACQAGDIETLRRVLAQIGERTDLMAWRVPGALETCRTLAK